MIQIIKLMKLNKINEISNIFQALGEPTRLRILDYIDEKGKACTIELSKLLGKDKSVIFRHMKTLVDTGILLPERKGLSIYYRISKPNIIKFIEKIIMEVKMRRYAFASESDDGLNSMLSAHFGRCPYFVLVDVDDKNDVTSVYTRSNKAAGNHAPGVVPEFIKSLGAQFIVTGGMGPRAISFFEQFGIEPITGTSGSIESVLKQILGENFKISAEPCNEAKHPNFE